MYYILFLLFFQYVNQNFYRKGRLKLKLAVISVDRVIYLLFGFMLLLETV